ncbi:MAG: alpha/beta hydrolase [Candidatus Woesearchaeota archaeon]
MAEEIIQGIRVYYNKTGKGKPLIFVHGMLSDCRAYHRIIRILSTRYKVYAVDLPMHGFSGTPPRYFSGKDLAATIDTLAGKLGIINPIICAHSGGALIALELSKKAKELILLEPAGQKYNGSMFEFFYSFVIRKAAYDIIHNPIRAIALGINGIWNCTRNIFHPNYWRLFNDNLYRNNIPRGIRCKTTIIWADHEEVFDKKYQQGFKIKNSRTIIVHGNHDWPILRPQEINKFLS